MTWTPDRPTKPGKYWLSIHPDKRPGEQHPDVLFPAVIACEVTQVVEWMLGEENANALDHEQFSRVWAVKYRSGGAWLRLADAWFDRALWCPYVEPADPHAQPVDRDAIPETRAYRMSNDPKTPNLRLILTSEPGMVTLYEADMTSRSDTAQETERHDKIVMSPDDARWLRDQLVALFESEGM